MDQSRHAGLLYWFRRSEFKLPALDAGCWALGGEYWGEQNIKEPEDNVQAASEPLDRDTMPLTGVNAPVILLGAIVQHT